VLYNDGTNILVRFLRWMTDCCEMAVGCFGCILVSEDERRQNIVMKRSFVMACTLAAVSSLAFAGYAQMQTVAETALYKKGGFEALSEKAIADFRKLTNKRIAEIRATSNMDIPVGAECRYLSATGDDSADGKTPSTAWRTTERLNRERLPKGVFVLFERGGVFRGGFKASAGVTYTA
jgi:hypothetical protein